PHHHLDPVETEVGGHFERRSSGLGPDRRAGQPDRNAPGDRLVVFGELVRCHVLLTAVVLLASTQRAKPGDGISGTTGASKHRSTLRANPRQPPLETS